MEPDSRSSSFAFMQGSLSVTINWRQRRRPMNYDGKNSDHTHACEQQFREEVDVQTGDTNENEVEIKVSPDDLVADLSWASKEAKTENHQPSADQDLLVKSLLTLKRVEEALENEVQQFREIGTDSVSLHGNSSEAGSVAADSTFPNPQIQSRRSSGNLISGEIGESASSSLGMKVLSLKQNVKPLESKLEETRAMLEMKELKVAELEEYLRKYYIDVMGNEVVFKMQKRVCKTTSFFIIQFILLVLVWLFFLQLSPRSWVSVPT